MSSRLCPFCMKMTDQTTCPHCGKQTNYAGQPLHLPAGFVVSGKHPYVLGAALGQGGFGITYIALDMITGQRVAIKEYFPTHCSGRTGNNAVTAYQNQTEVFQKGKVRFLDEARTLKTLSDLKSIVNVLDFFEANNSAYLVMEFLEGISLKDYAARKGKFPARKFLSQIKPLMEDIQRMHERGVIHRDIAPDNIILMPDGRMKLIDFGAARSYVGDKSMTMVVKKGFAPVEQYLSHGSTASTDVYALAATIYYCITGKVPPDSADREYAGFALPSPSSLGADLTPQQERAILKAMKIQQKERTQSVKAFLEDLNRKRGIILPLSRRKLLVLILAALAVLVLLLGVFLLCKPAGPDTGYGSPATEAGSPAPDRSGEETPSTAVPADTEEDENASSDSEDPTEATQEAGTSSADKAPSNKPSGSGSNSGSGSKPSSGGSSGSGSSSGSQTGGNNAPSDSIGGSSSGSIGDSSFGNSSSGGIGGAIGGGIGGNPSGGSSSGSSSSGSDSSGSSGGSGSGSGSSSGGDSDGSGGSFSGGIGGSGGSSGSDGISDGSGGSFSGGIGGSGGSSGSDGISGGIGGGLGGLGGGDSSGGGIGGDAGGL